MKIKTIILYYKLIFFIYLIFLIKKLVRLKFYLKTYIKKDWLN